MTKDEVEIIVERYDEYLKLEGIFDPDFEITDDLVYLVFFKYVFPSYKRDRTGLSDSAMRKYEKFMAKQLNYTRLSLLRVKYFRNGNCASGIKEGYVYIARNKAWPTYFKIGSTINVSERLSVYQSYSPKRDFEIVSYYFVDDRFKEERDYHKMLKADHEWVETTFVNGRSSYQAMKKHFNELHKRDFNKSIDKIRHYLIIS